MNEKRLEQIRDSVEFQLEVAEHLKIDKEVILEEKELLDEIDRLKKDIKFYEYGFNKFKERFEKGTEYIKTTKYCGTKIDRISLEEYLNKLLNILEGKDE